VVTLALRWWFILVFAYERNLAHISLTETQCVVDMIMVVR